LSGSHNYLLADDFVESMVGRASMIDMSTMSFTEMNETNLAKLMFRGGYPKLFVDQDMEIDDFFTQYLKNYLDREVLQVHKIQDLDNFEAFMRIMADCVGSPFNAQGVAGDLQVPLSTVRGWINILVSSFMIFKSPPYFKNFKKSLIHHPKYYFYDSGLLTHLRGIEVSQGVMTPHLKGKFFENFVASELKKKMINSGSLMKSLYYFQTEKDSSNEAPYEVDFIIDKGTELFSVEIKSRDTIRSDDFTNMNKFAKLTKVERFVIYTGPTTQTPDGTALNWSDIGRLLEV
jgi:predicted AAA+ superfamily ATPase